MDVREGARFVITFFVAFLCSVMVGAVLTLVVRNRALAYGWFDQARSSRKIHSHPVPRLGGVAIVGAFFTPLAALLVVDSGVGLIFRAQEQLVVGLFAGGFSIAALGLWDDFIGAGARVKFGVQLLVALGLYALGFRVELIANPFGTPIELGWMALPFTVLWMVGVVNAMNLIDGLDGLAGGVAFFGVATNFALAFFRGDILVCLLMAALAGALLGFLIFNFNPASIFMGDTGSMFLGFVLAAVSIKTSTKSGTTVAIIVPIIALGLPIMDTLLAMLRRTLMGRPVFSADKEHIHHRLMSRLLLSHRHAVLVLYGLCCLLALTALALNFANSAQSAILLTGVGVVVFVLMRKLGYLTLRDAQTVATVRRRNLQLRSQVREVIAAVEQAHSTQELWNAVRPLGEAMQASLLRLRIERQVNGLSDGVTFELVRPGTPSVQVQLPLQVTSTQLGRLEVGWAGGRLEVNRDEELAAELLADALARAVLRLEPRPARSGPHEAKVVALRR